MKMARDPIDIKVIDPLNIADGYFECKFIDYDTEDDNAADTAKWIISRFTEKGGELIESISSELTIQNNFEQLIPKWGVSVRIRQQSEYTKYEGSAGSPTQLTTEVIGSEIRFADSSKRWLSFIGDQDNYSPLNWIRSGATDIDAANDPFVTANGFNNPLCYNDENYDEEKNWAKIISGGWAPHALVGYQCDYMPLAYFTNSPKYPTGTENAPSGRTLAALAYSPGVDIVITSDKSKWTKCPVIELGRDVSLNTGQAPAGLMRRSSSLDRNGNQIAGTGTSWFLVMQLTLNLGYDFTWPLVKTPSSEMTEEMTWFGIHPTECSTLRDLLV